MLEVILTLICAVLVVPLALQYLSHRNTKRQLEEIKRQFEETKRQHEETKNQLAEYKTLFELSDQSFKESQDKIQSLLEAASQNSVLLERGANALTVSNTKLLDQNVIIQRLASEVEILRQTVEFQIGQYEKLLGQKKSSEVRTGKITEQLSPFLSDYPLNPKTAKFIGDPIDFIHFDDDKITFVEVKSGKSQLSKRQREIRDLVKAGKVEFTIYRVEGKL